MRKNRSKPVTPEMAAHIRFLLKRKNLYQHQIAALLEVNQGRISEVATGKRHPNVAPSQGSFPF